MTDKKFEFILFDLIGTTIRDSHNGGSLILDAFHKSFHINGFEISYDQVNLQRGKSKKEAIRNILKENSLGDVLINRIYNDFIELLNNSKDNFAEIKGAKEIFRTLNEKGIKIGIGSGLPIDFMQGIIKQVGWAPGSFDYIGSSDDLGIGRPDPIMINDAFTKLSLLDKRKILKIGDTFVDIQEGKNAGVLTAGVLTGTQNRETLQKFDPDYILDDINEIMDIV